MSELHRRWLISLYPRAWRDRYGDEMDELLREGCGWRDVLDVARYAASERLLYWSRRGVEAMQTYPGDVAVMLRKPSAFAPVVMSLIALIVVLVAIAIAGAKPEPDEGAVAHVWQLLMAGQLPILGWFAVNWLRRDIRSGLAILAVQLVAFAAALLPVWLLGL